jgi:biotin transport system substrate-specific component
MSHSAVLTDALWIRPSAKRLDLLRSAVLAAGFAIATGALAQWEIRLGFTPVPITGQTLGVLLAGASLGPRLGSASMAAYWVLGLFLPFYAGGDQGWDVATGASLGYFVGFVAAAALVGLLAERRHDRSFVSSFAAMAMGTVVIYVCGASWLARHLGIPVATGDENAIAFGVTPFLIGDLVKMVIAGALLPASWKLVGRLRGHDALDAER